MSTTKSLLIADVERRLCEESIPRIEKCLNTLNENDLWWRPNDSGNSIANLILHLNGNVRQWIFSGLLGAKDMRTRSLEFSSRNNHAKTELNDILTNLSVDLKKKLPLLHDIDLSQEKTIQGFEENGVSILMHVVEHFSYHTGQIALLTKAMKNKDLGFYGNSHLNDLNP
ncbi:MAG: DinB family protein [Bacteroidota bacterium]